MEKRILPEFKSEAEEAKWWFDHQDELDGEFVKAAAEGRLGRGTTARLAGASSNLLQLDPTDFEMARQQAAKRGVQYYAYLKQLIHEALLREEKAS